MSDKLIEPRIVTADDIRESMITEYVETGEGDGISVLPLREKEELIDGKHKLIVDNIDAQK